MAWLLLTIHKIVPVEVKSLLSHHCRKMELRRIKSEDLARMTLCFRDRIRPYTISSLSVRDVGSTLPQASRFYRTIGLSRLAHSVPNAGDTCRRKSSEAGSPTNTLS